MNEDLMATMAAYREKAARLSVFHSGLDALLREKSGKGLMRWEEEAQYLTPRQLAWREMHYFYSSAIVNNGDLFFHLEKVNANRAALEEIGAVKTLAAADSLSELRARYDALGQDERDGLREVILAERDRTMAECDGLVGFAELLIRHAESYPEEFPEGRDRYAQKERSMRALMEDRPPVAERPAEVVDFKRGVEDFLAKKREGKGGVAEMMKDLLEAKGQPAQGKVADLKRLLDAAGGLDEVARRMEERKKEAEEKRAGAE